MTATTKLVTLLVIAFLALAGIFVLVRSDSSKADTSTSVTTVACKQPLLNGPAVPCPLN